VIVAQLGSCRAEEDGKDDQRQDFELDHGAEQVFGHEHFHQESGRQRRLFLRLGLLFVRLVPKLFEQLRPRFGSKPAARRNATKAALQAARAETDQCCDPEPNEPG